DLPSQVGEEFVVDDLLIEGRVFAPAVLARIIDEELALRDGGGAEGVGLDNVRACLEKTAVDVANHLWLGQREQIAVVQQILLRIAETFAADVRLRHPVGANGGAHRAIDDGDALFEDPAQGMLRECAHVGWCYARTLGSGECGPGCTDAIEETAKSGTRRGESAFPGIRSVNFGC